jgi:hypothetical protein
MLELLALALFQIASLTGSFNVAQPHQQPVVVTSDTDNDTGNGGWGHDRPVNDGTTYQQPSQTGNGGWGHD